MRRAPRTDSNHTEIVSALRQVGCKVQSLAGMAGGVPDLLVYCPRSKRLILMEVKDGSLIPSLQALTSDQVRWHASWAEAPLYVVRSVEEAIMVATRA